MTHRPGSPYTVAAATLLLCRTTLGEERREASLMSFLRRAYSSTQAQLEEEERGRRKQSRVFWPPFFIKETGSYSGATCVFPLYYRSYDRRKQGRFIFLLPLLSGIARTGSDRGFCSVPLLSCGGTMMGGDWTALCSLPLLTQVFYSKRGSERPAMYSAHIGPLYVGRGRDDALACSAGQLGLRRPLAMEATKYEVSGSRIWPIFSRASMRDRRDGRQLQSRGTVGPLAALCSWQRRDDRTETFGLFNRVGRAEAISSAWPYWELSFVDPQEYARKAFDRGSVTRTLRMGVVDYVVGRDMFTGETTRRKLSLLPLWGYEESSVPKRRVPSGLLFERETGKRLSCVSLGPLAAILRHTRTWRAREVSIAGHTLSVQWTRRHARTKLLWGLLFSHHPRNRSLSVTPLFMTQRIGSRRIFRICGLPVVRAGKIPSIGDGRIDRELARLVHAHAQHRCSAIRKLARFREPRTVPFLADALRDPSPRVRRAAAGALAEIGDPRSVPALIALLEEGEVDDRFYAVNALSKLRAELALPTLERARLDLADKVREGAYTVVANRMRMSPSPSAGKLREATE